MDARKVILAPLYALGNTPLKIAKSLKTKGVKGTHDPDSCPLANVLSKVYPKQEVRVDNETIIIDGVTINVTDTVFAAFVDAFDAVEANDQPSAQEKPYKDLEEE